MHTIRVDVGKGYDISIGEGILEQAGETVKKAAGEDARIAIVTDSNVADLYLDKFRESLETAGLDYVTITFPAGEASKNMGTLSNILEELAEKEITRKDTIVALGGGVTGDMSGFAAGCFMRGIGFIQVPTTLLAAVDSSVGGKTAVDLKSGKNLAGLFYQPQAVICDTSLMSSLPLEEYRCGLAEAIKTGILSGEELFSVFEKPDSRRQLPEIIQKCAQYKAGVVMRDEKENGERKLLNLGHTIGHAIERLSDYSIKHGYAVAAGTALIARASAVLGWSEIKTAKRIENVFTTNGLPVDTAYDSASLAVAALSDKKRKGDTITIAVPEKIGGCTLKEINVTELEKIIELGKEDLI